METQRYYMDNQSKSFTVHASEQTSFTEVILRGLARYGRKPSRKAREHLCTVICIHSDMYSENGLYTVRCSVHESVLNSQSYCSSRMCTSTSLLFSENCSLDIVCTFGWGISTLSQSERVITLGYPEA